MADNSVHALASLFQIDLAFNFEVTVFHFSSDYFFNAHTHTHIKNGNEYARTKRHGGMKKEAKKTKKKNNNLLYLRILRNEREKKRKEKKILDEKCSERWGFWAREREAKNVYERKKTHNEQRNPKKVVDWICGVWVWLVYSHCTRMFACECQYDLSKIMAFNIFLRLCYFLLLLVERGVFDSLFQSGDLKCIYFFCLSFSMRLPLLSPLFARFSFTTLVACMGKNSQPILIRWFAIFVSHNNTLKMLL